MLTETQRLNREIDRYQNLMARQEAQDQRAAERSRLRAIEREIARDLARRQNPVFERPADDTDPAPILAALERAKPLSAILTEVAAKHGVTVTMLLSHRRPPHIVRARHEAYWRAHEETMASLPEIGRAYNRDHTSIMFGVKQHARRRAEGAVA